MPDLIAKPALDRGPMTCGQTTLAVGPWTALQSIAPMPGKTEAVTAALQAFGLSFPASNSWNGTEARRIVWTGRAQAFLMGATLAGGEDAALTDQSDGWVTLTLSGPASVAVLARLVSLDLREAKAGFAARTALNHMPLILIAEGDNRFTLMTFRSMAQTAWHELHEAMLQVQARSET